MSNKSSLNLKKTRHSKSSKLYHYNHHKSNHYYLELERDQYCPNYIVGNQLHDQNGNNDDSCNNDENGSDLTNLNLLGVNISSTSSIPPIVYSTINHLQKQCIAERQLLQERQSESKRNRKRNRKYTKNDGAKYKKQTRDRFGSGSYSSSCSGSPKERHQHPIFPPSPSFSSNSSTSSSSMSSSSSSSSCSASDGDESSNELSQCGQCPSNSKVVTS